MPSKTTTRPRKRPAAKSSTRRNTREARPARAKKPGEAVPTDSKRAPSPPAAAAEKVSTIAASKAVAEYLAECKRLGFSAKGRARKPGVSLGALEGFPGFTSDPEVIERAIVEIEQRASVEPSPIKEIRMRQRVRDLRDAKSSLNGHSKKDGFIEHGSAFAVRHSISYEVFREMGVPADVLKEAGIAR